MEIYYGIRHNVSVVRPYLPLIFVNHKLHFLMRRSFHLLLWPLGFIDQLSYPSNVCNVGEDVKHLFSGSEDEFRNAAVLRSKQEIFDQADLILRLSWACVDARMKQQAPPAELNGSVVYERHYALNWLICFYDQDWDHVTMNT